MSIVTTSGTITVPIALSLDLANVTLSSATGMTFSDTVALGSLTATVTGTGVMTISNTITTASLTGATGGVTPTLATSVNAAVTTGTSST